MARHSSSQPINQINSFDIMATMNQKPDSQAVKVERAIPGDAEIICDIRDKAWLEAYPNEALGITVEDIRIRAQGKNGEITPKRIIYWKKDIEKDDGVKQTTFVARVDGEVKGYVAPRLEDGRRFIGAMYVLPDYQGQGIGSKLIDEALKWYGADKDIYLEVVSYNQKAIDFYKRFGFEITDTIVDDTIGLPDYIKILPVIEMVRKAKSL